jgi:hypothetical protein
VLTRVFTFTVGDAHELVARTHLALLSALAWAPPGTEVVLVTDRPAQYAWLGRRIRLCVVDGDQLRAWRGAHDFFWRAKLMAILHVAEEAPGPLLYLDSDTLVRRPLDDLFAALAAGDVLLHAYEHDLARARRRGDRRLWRALRGRTAAGTTFAPPCPMWNAGVVGVGAGRLDRLARARELCDALLASGVGHWLVEQLAFCVSLGETGRLRAAEPWITHYWGNKDGFQPAIDAQLASFLCASLDPDAAALHVRRHPIHRPVRVHGRWWRKLLAAAAARGAR